LTIGQSIAILKSVICLRILPSDFDLEIAHVLFLEIVGYSKLLTDRQRVLIVGDG